MARVAPLARGDLPELADYFAVTEERMGFLPGSQLIMARKAGLADAFINLAAAIFGASTEGVSRELKYLVGNLASAAAGCRYCQAHTASNASRGPNGVAAKKLDQLWSYETSDLFSAAERAALRYARCAAAVPNAVTDDVFADLKRHFSDDDIGEITAVIAFYGYLNRWNDTLQTDLEAMPTAIGNAHLAAQGWDRGNHTLVPDAAE